MQSAWRTSASPASPRRTPTPSCTTRSPCTAAPVPSAVNPCGHPRLVAASLAVRRLPPWSSRRLLLRFGPLQVLMEEVEGAFAVDGVGAVEDFHLAALRDMKSSRV